jgi:hypothetical protein
MSELDLALSIALGIGLAAATGFRVFLPMLVMSAAAEAGYLPLSEDLAWLGTPSALTMLAIAALVEILAYYIPGLDNLLDGLAAPASVVAGTVAAAAVMANSTLLTGGFGNAVIATAELVGALLTSLLAIAAPVVALLMVLAFAWFAFRLIRRLRRRMPPPSS